MNSIAKLENDLFERWSHSRSISGFISDGVINEECFNSVSPRIVFVLKDSNGGEKGYNLRELISKGNHPGERGTWWPIANMMAAIDGVKGELVNTPECKAKYFQRLGIMNLKKTPGGSVTDPVELRRFVKENVPFLVEQIKLYADRPTIFVCGGTFELFCKIAKEGGIPCESRDGMMVFGSGCVAFAMYHPASRRSMNRKVDAFLGQYNKAISIAKAR